MTEFQHFKKSFLSEAGAGLNHQVTVTDWFSLLDQAASQRDREKENKYKPASVGQPRFAWEALTCCQGDFSNAATAKSSKAAVPLSSTQLRVGVSLHCLYLIQEFAQYISEYEVSMISIVSPIRFWTGLFVYFLNLSMKTLPESRMDTRWWTRRAAGNGSTATAAALASAWSGRPSGSWSGAQHGSPPPGQTLSLLAAREQVCKESLLPTARPFENL